MEPNELADGIENLILAANEKYGKSLIKIQQQLYDDIFLKLKDLELDELGYIKQNTVNRKILREAQEQFDVMLSTPAYQVSVTNQIKVVDKINALNTKYFETIKSNFTPNKNFLKSLQSQTIQNVNDMIMQDGIRAQIKIPLNQILEQNVSSGGSFKGMLEQLQNFIKGNDQVEGRLLKYARNYTSDILFQYSRSFQQAITAELNLTWYSYSGGLLDRSRPFCVERAGNFYTQSEVESWAKLHWKGKDPLTTESSIFVLVAGYGCRHQLIPVHESIVPKDTIKAAEDAGYI